MEAMKGLAKVLIVALCTAAGVYLGVLLAPQDLSGQMASCLGIVFVGGGAIGGLIVGCLTQMAIL